MTPVQTPHNLQVKEVNTTSCTADIKIMVNMNHLRRGHAHGSAVDDEGEALVDGDEGRRRLHNDRRSCIEKMSSRRPNQVPTHGSRTRHCCPGSRSLRRTGRPGGCTDPGRRTPTRSTCRETRAGWECTRSRHSCPRSRHLRHSARS